MAIDWNQWKKEIAAGNKDWVGAAQGEYGEYLYKARRRFERGEAATVAQVKEVYRRTAASIREDIESLTPGTLRYSHLKSLAGTLEKCVRQMNDETLQAIQSGLTLAVDQASEGAEQVTMSLLDDVFERPAIKWMFADINQRAVLSLLARTGPDGLKLSDRVWRIGQTSRKAITTLVEDGVARGSDARTLAREVQRYLQPDKWTALKAETRRRLGVPKDISMEAMRLAVTEMQHAFHEGTINSYRAIPSAKGIYWRLSSSHPIPDVCDDYASHNGNGFWPKGQEPAKPHPWCRCIAVPAMEDPKEFTQRLREWMENPASHPDIEEWYNSTARRFLKRPGKTHSQLGSPINNIVANYMLEGGKKRTVQITKTGKTKIVVPTDLDISKQVFEAQDIAREFQKLPSRLQDIVEEIQVLDYRNPADAYWERIYGIPNFRSYATGGNGQIHLFANNHVSAQENRERLLGVLAHEAGHNLDREIARKMFLSTEYFSESDEWTGAREMDMLKGSGEWVSKYAEAADSVHEDWAESIELYVESPDKFNQGFPNRTQIIRRELQE